MLGNMKAKSLAAVVSLCLCISACTLAGAGEQPAGPPKVGDLVEDVGTFLDLEGGERLQLVVEDRKIIATVVDAEDKIVAHDIESILLEADTSSRRADDFRTILHPDGEARLVGTQFIYPPYQFRAKLIIRFTDCDPTTFPNALLNLDRNPSTE